MEEKRWKQVFDNIMLSPEEKETLWTQLKQRTEKRPVRRSVLRVAAMLAVMICAGIGATLIVDGFTGGRLASALSGIWRADRESEQIVETVTDYYHMRLDSVYAPELIECSDERVIFANSFGLVVYDRKRQCLSGTIDLEKIQCNYFNADTLQTKFLIRGDMLTVYNLSGKKVSGDCYVFDLNACRNKENGIVALEPVETRKASHKLEKEWKKQSKNRVSTWESYVREKDEDLSVAKMYSEYSLQWESGDRTGYSSFLVIDEKAGEEGTPWLTLYHRCSGEDTVIKETLNIRVDGIDTAKAKDLPAYRYMGKDPIERALAECFENDRKRYAGQYITGGKTYDAIAGTQSGNADLTLPLVDIVGVKKGKKYTKVYGTFRWLCCSLSGKTLYESDCSGGIGAAYLKETEDGYTVKKILCPRDGSMYTEDLKVFCEGDEEMAAKIMDNDINISRIAVRVLKQYVKQNKLDIRYYKEFGWDPYELQ